VRAGRPTIRSICIAVTVAAAGSGLAVGLPPVAARADVSHQIAVAEAQLAAMQRQADALSARFDAASVALGTAEQQAADARARVALAAGRIRALREEIGAFAAAAYRGQGDSALSVITSTSPQNFVDEVTALDAVSRGQTAALAQLAVAQHQQRAAQAAADAALSRQRAVTRSLAAARQAIEASAARQLRLLRHLQAEEAAIIRAARIAAARAAAARRAAILRAEQAAAARAAQLAAEAAATRAAQQTFATTPAVTAPPTGSGGAPVAVQWAYAEIGKPYVWGAAGPDSFDCSGLTQYVWGKAGVYLPHYTVSQYDSEPRVPRADLQPGDLVFFPGSDGTWSAPGHVGIYVGGGMMIDAPYTGVDVREEAVPWDQFVGAVRP
jgi:cell wall-associated NlpC family hydrolase